MYLGTSGIESLARTVLFLVLRATARRSFPEDRLTDSLAGAARHVGKCHGTLLPVDSGEGQERLLLLLVLLVARNAVSTPFSRVHLSFSRSYSLLLSLSLSFLSGSHDLCANE